MNWFMIKLTASPSYSFHTGLKNYTKEKPFSRLSLAQLQVYWALKSLIRRLQRSCFLSGIQHKCSGKFSQIHRIKQRKEPTYPGNEFWYNSKQHYLVYECKIYENPKRFDRDRKTSVMTSWTCWRERQRQHRKSENSRVQTIRALSRSEMTFPSSC